MRANIAIIIVIGIYCIAGAEITGGMASMSWGLLQKYGGYRAIALKMAAKTAISQGTNASA
jgi:hypothetical protein